MARFRYKARRPDGKVIRRYMDVSDYSEAYMLLEEKKLEPIDIVQVEANFEDRKLKKISLKEVTIFCRQFATMISSGIPLVKALDIMRVQARKERKKNLQTVYERLYQDVQKGFALYEAMLAQGGVFPPMLIHMVQAGEVGGSLDTVIERTAEYYDSQNKLINRVNSSMMYPKILLFMIVFIVLALFAFVLPKFFVVFEQLDLELPMMTKVVISISDFIIQKWYVLVIIAITCILIFQIAMTNDRFAYQMDYRKTRFPIVKIAVEKLAIANFTSTMGVLYSSGVSLLQSLEIAASVVNNRFYQDRFHQIIIEVEGGKPLSQALEEADIFDPMVTSLISIGEEAGNLEEVFETTSDFYMNEAEEAIARMITALEPIVIIVIGVLVLFVVAAVLMPTFSMATQISDQAGSGNVSAGGIE